MSILDELQDYVDGKADVDLERWIEWAREMVKRNRWSAARCRRQGKADYRKAYLMQALYWRGRVRELKSELLLVVV